MLLITEWQRAILDSDFTDCQPLPHDLEDEYQQSSYHLDHLKTLKQALQPWADGKDSESGEGWCKNLIFRHFPKDRPDTSRIQNPQNVRIDRYFSYWLS